MSKAKKEYVVPVVFTAECKDEPFEVTDQITYHEGKAKLWKGDCMKFVHDELKALKRRLEKLDIQDGGDRAGFNDYIAQMEDAIRFTGMLVREAGKHGSDHRCRRTVLMHVEAADKQKAVAEALKKARKMQFPTQESAL